MVNEIGFCAEHGPAQNPRPVSRGVKLQSGFVGIDSLYLVVEYPHKDVFEYWSEKIDDIHDVRLNDGIPHENMVIRRGLIGYKLSVWFEDARLLITDRVEENLIGTPSEGQGMGVMLQIGPKWLRRYGDKSQQHLLLNVLGQLHLYGLQEPEKYPIRLNRIDIAVDVIGLRVADFSTDEWRRQWVGFASKMNFHTASRSRDLQGLSIGSSEGQFVSKSMTKKQKPNKEERQDSGGQFGALMKMTKLSAWRGLNGLSKHTRRISQKSNTWPILRKKRFTN